MVNSILIRQVVHVTTRSTARDERFLAQLRDDDGPAVIRAGVLRRERFEHWPVRTTDEMVVTRNRRAHYLERHPEVIDDEPILLRTLLDPDEVHRNAIGLDMAILYRRIDDEHYLRAPVWISHRADRQNSLLSLRRARLIEVEDGKSKGRQVWKK